MTFIFTFTQFWQKQKANEGFGDWRPIEADTYNHIYSILTKETDLPVSDHLKLIFTFIFTPIRLKWG